MPSPPSYSKSQSGRPAGSVPDAELGHAADVARESLRRDGAGAAPVDGHAASRRSTSSARRSSPSASTSTRRSSRRARSASTRSRRPIAGANVNRPTGTLLRPEPQLRRADQRAVDERRRVPADSSSPTATAARCVSSEVAQRLRRRREPAQRQLVQRHADDLPGDLSASPAPTPCEVVDSRQGAAAGTAGAAAGGARARHPQRPLGLDPRVGRRRQVHAAF